MMDINVKYTDHKFRVNNIFCVGKNYTDHILEMQPDQAKPDIPEEPVIFLKPNTSLVYNGGFSSIPLFEENPVSNSLQNEVELVIAVGNDGNNIKLEDAFSYVYGYAIGIDLTLRDIQSKLKEKGLPWTKSKGFFGSAPVSDIVKKELIDDPNDLEISLKVNGEVRQSSNTSLMIFKVDYLVYYISCIYGIRKGDLIFTGTPSGISDLKSGDIINAEITKLGNLKISIN